MKYWSGTAWVETAPPPLPAPKAKNTPSTWSLILGVVALLINVVGFIGVASIITGIIGLSRASRFKERVNYPIGRAKSVLGIVLGVLGVIAFCTLSVPLIVNLTTGSSYQYDQAELEQEITKGEAAQNVILTDVSCPTDPHVEQGIIVQCVAKLDGSNVVVAVTFQDDHGSIIYRVSN